MLISLFLLIWSVRTTINSFYIQCNLLWSPFLCLVGSCYSIFSFMCMFCRSLFDVFVLFLLAIVLSVRLRYTDSDYPFGSFKFFLACSERDILQTSSPLLFTGQTFPIITWQSSFGGIFLSATPERAEQR